MPLSPTTQALLDATIADAGSAAQADTDDASAAVALAAAQASKDTTAAADLAAHQKVTASFQAFVNALAVDEGQPPPFPPPAA